MYLACSSVSSVRCASKEARCRLATYSSVVGAVGGVACFVWGLRLVRLVVVG